MSNVCSTNSLISPRQTWFAAPAAAALCTFGVVIAPGAAQAAPCSNWEFPHGYVGISQTTPNNGFSFRFDSQPAAQQAIAGAPVDASNNKHGTAIGSIAGHHMDVTVTWDDGTTQHYAGDVAGDGSHANGTEPFAWQSYNTAFTCADPAPAAKPDTPKQGDQPADQPAVQPTATVLKKTDIYSAPNGDGTQFKDADGVPIFKSPGTVQLVAPELCDTNTHWCHVVAPEVPGGTGFIYIGDGLGTFP
ncbi:MAG: hypothetical protein ACXVGO_01880 [Mycobacterium sp.]